MSYHKLDLIKIFESFDVSKNKLLDISEFKSFVKDLDLNCDPRGVEEIFNSICGDDKQISVEEFIFILKWIYNILILKYTIKLFRQTIL